jgi:hypothetical protein
VGGRRGGFGLQVLGPSGARVLWRSARRLSAPGFLPLLLASLQLLRGWLSIQGVGGVVLGRPSFVEALFLWEVYIWEGLRWSGTD